MKITDIIIPVQSANSMIRITWNYASEYAKEMHTIWKRFYYNPNDKELSMKPVDRNCIAWIKIELDFTFRIQNVYFLDGIFLKTAESATGALLDNLKVRLIEELDKYTVYSYESDVQRAKIVDYPVAYEYLNDIVKNKYGKAEGFDPDLNILSIPEELWKTYGLVNAYAYYSPSKKHCVFPKAEDPDGLWAMCIKVHEGCHFQQHRDGILLTPDETGMTNEDFNDLAAIIDQYQDIDGFEKIAEVVQVPINLLKRIQIITNKLSEYHKDYYNVLTERQAHAEQFNFLKKHGVSTEKILVKLESIYNPRGKNPNWGALKYIIENSEDVALESHEKMLKMLD